MFEDAALPIIFVGLMGLSMLIYVVLDGFDLGVGILIADADEEEKDTMIASIGPFWDANETWLVLGVGILLVAFPKAHGIILTALYLPVFAMLFGLILRGVAFDFRAKVPLEKKWIWNTAFFAGSLIAALAQGFMLGLYLVGLETGLAELLFACLVAVGVAAAYAFIGATWLIMKTEGELQVKAIWWARRLLWVAAAGMIAVSVATPLVSPRVFENWFSFPNIVYLSPIPTATAALFLLLLVMLPQMPYPKDRHCWVPFVASIGVFVLGFAGLAYSFYPYIVPDRLTIHEAASAPESLFIILIGALAVLPVIVGYSIYAYWVFRGKAGPLSYGG